MFDCVGSVTFLRSKKSVFLIRKNYICRNLSFGRGQTFELRGGKLPTVQNTEAWDGQDQALPVDEDIDLSDVVLDDLKEEL